MAPLIMQEHVRWSITFSFQNARCKDVFYLASPWFQCILRR